MIFILFYFICWWYCAYWEHTVSDFIIYLHVWYGICDQGSWLALLFFVFGSWGVSLSFGLHLSHTWYFIDLLHHSSLNECKPCSTPLFATFCTLLSIVTWSTLFNIWLWLVLIVPLQFMLLSSWVPFRPLILLLVNAFCVAPKAP